MPQKNTFFAFESHFDDVFAKLFSVHKIDRLRFGPSAFSIGTSNRVQIKTGSEFRDYILERFLDYRLTLQPSGEGCVLGIESLDKDRVDQVLSAVRHYLKAKELVAVQIEITDPPPNTF